MAVALLSALGVSSVQTGIPYSDCMRRYVDSLKVNHILPVTAFAPEV